MASFGSFETEREVYSGPSFIVYSARKVGDPSAEYAIKVFGPVSTSLGAESANRGAPLMADIEQPSVERIALQREAAASSKFISPIFETGRDERGVWYVTRFYPLSVNKIISGRVELNREGVEHIIRAMAQGAVDIKRTCGRSHGDIQPSYVRISRSESLSEAEVVLTDPLPGDQWKAETYELADLRAIGRILLQLVLERASDDDEALIFPVLASPEWTRLFGKNADRWLSLCNRLLHPNLSLRQLNLEQLVDQLEQLRAGRRVSREVIWAAAAALVALGAAAIFTIRHFSPAEPADAIVELESKEQGRTPSTNVTVEPRSTAQVSKGQTIAVVTNSVPVPESDVVVEFSSQPSGATVAEGTNVLGVAPFRKRLAPGSHAIRAQFEDWPAVTNQVNIVAGSNAPVEFYIRHGWLKLERKPEEAQVRINNKTIDRERSTVLLRPDTYAVIVEHPGYESLRTNIVISQGQSSTLPALKPLFGFVEFRTDPPGAAIFDAKAPQKELGRAQPGQPFKTNFAPGTYSFIAKYEGLDSVTNQRVEVSAGTTIAVPLSFKYGSVRFETQPPEAAVFIAGREAPKTNIQKPGPISYRVEMADYEAQAGEVIAVEGKVVSAPVHLKRKQVNLVLRSDPPNARFYLGGNPLTGTNDVYDVPWGTQTIAATYRGLDSITNSVEVDKRGITSTQFVFNYATLEITNAETRLLLSNTLIAERFVYLKPEVQYDFVVEHLNVRTNLPIKLAAKEAYRPTIVWPEVRSSFTNSIGMVLVRMPANDKYPQGFWVGKYETTEGEYLKVMGDNSVRREPLPMARGIWRQGMTKLSTYRIDAKHPQVMLTAQQAIDFCSRLTQMDKAAGKVLPGMDYYTLPTEEQWEYFVGDAQLEGAITSKGSNAPRTKPEPVDGSRRANRYGLNDVRGNVSEMCLAQDGSLWMRGGAFNDFTESGPYGSLGLKYRKEAPLVPSSALGFRVVCVPDSPGSTAQK